jgi:hypothetical protein
MRGEKKKQKQLNPNKKVREDYRGIPEEQEKTSKS